MEQTFQYLAEYMRKHATHVYTPGRKTRHLIPNAMEIGFADLMEGKVYAPVGESEVDLEVEANLELAADLELEVEDGDLEV